MSLTLYIGPMFAGKSSTVLATVRRNTIIGRKTLCITSNLDKRYGPDASRITSHDQDSVPAVAAAKLMPMMERKDYYDADTVIIEEAQFFTDLKDFALEAVEVHNKEVIVVGLDGDSSRRPFGQILDLIPFADSIHKMTALCTHCGNGTAGLFSYRKPSAASNEQINVGAQDQYEPLCRWHYLSAVMEDQKKEHMEIALKEGLPPEQELNRCMQLFGVDEGATLYGEIVRKQIAERRPRERPLRGRGVLLQKQWLGGQQPRS
jgi:thymidine kinase